MARYLLGAFIAVCIVTTAVSIQSKRNMQHQKNVRNWPSGDFYCDDEPSKPFPGSWICDTVTDCAGGEDETDCTYFYCDDGSAIATHWICDTENDCAGGEDEKDCTSTTYNPPASDTTYYPPASGTASYPQPTDYSPTSYVDCECTCPYNSEMEINRSIKARVSNTLRKDKQEAGKLERGSNKKQQNTRNYLEYLLRAMKAKRKERQ